MSSHSLKARDQDVNGMAYHFRGFQENLFLFSSSSEGCRHPLACGHISPSSASVIPLPPPLPCLLYVSSQNSLCCPFVVSHPTPTLPPGNHWLFSIPTVLPFLECHINGIMWYVCLWTWFLSSFLSLTKWNEFERHSCVACIKIVQLSLHLIPEHFQHSKNKSHTC